MHISIGMYSRGSTANTSKLLESKDALPAQDVRLVA